MSDSVSHRKHETYQESLDCPKSQACTEAREGCTKQLRSDVCGENSDGSAIDKI